MMSARVQSHVFKNKERNFKAKDSKIQPYLSKEFSDSKSGNN